MSSPGRVGGSSFSRASRGQGLRPLVAGSNVGGSSAPADHDDPKGNDPKAMRPQRDDAASAQSRSGPTKTLLIVDNVRLSRESLTHVLTSELADFEIVSVAEPTQASQCAVSPDVVLLNARGVRSEYGALLNDIATIHAGAHRTPVLLLADEGNAGGASEVTGAGIASLFPSNWGVALLIAAINLVVAGGQFHAPHAQVHKKLPAPPKGNGVAR